MRFSSLRVSVLYDCFFLSWNGDIFAVECLERPCPQCIKCEVDSTHSCVISRASNLHKLIVVRNFSPFDSQTNYFLFTLLQHFTSAQTSTSLAISMWLF